MFFTDSQKNIKEVLFFPTMKPQDEPSTKGILFNSVLCCEPRI
ncbi:unnamed protein product [Musa acuminata subsp. malaccensis]|uniref:(wild Malaysian banana) hypothetical protein n=1 Tax=Musa acuminata subsp. malaccensis TaxID=214687 RepID=A0A8D7FQR5_MUSAM|nr:unnamed protein product [Musa acuminata subsp. malaccensis]